MDKIEKMVKTDVAPHVSMLLVRDESQKASATFVGHNKVKMKNIFPWSSAIVPPPSANYQRATIAIVTETCHCAITRSYHGVT